MEISISLSLNALIAGCHLKGKSGGGGGGGGKKETGMKCELMAWYSLSRKVGLPQDGWRVRWKRTCKLAFLGFGNIYLIMRHQPQEFRSSRAGWVIRTSKGQVHET